MTRTLGSGPGGLYQLQAAIAAVHDEAPSAERTDWPRILALYDVLEGVSPGPMVTLNRAVALAMVDGPRPGSRSSGRSTTTNGWPTRTAWTPSVLTCSSSPATSPPPARRTCGGAPDGQPAGAALPLAPRGTSRIGPNAGRSAAGTTARAGGWPPGPPIATTGFGAYAASSWPRTAPPANAPLCTFT